MGENPICQYNFRLTSSTACPQSSTVPIFYPNIPSIIATNTLLPLNTFNVYSQSTLTSITINFGDSGSNAIQSCSISPPSLYPNFYSIKCPSYIYTKSGSYTITITSNPSNSITQSIDVKDCTYSYNGFYYDFRPLINSNPGGFNNFSLYFELLFILLKLNY